MIAHVPRRHPRIGEQLVAHEVRREEALHHAPEARAQRVGDPPPFQIAQHAQQDETVRVRWARQHPIRPEGGRQRLDQLGMEEQEIRRADARPEPLETRDELRRERAVVQGRGPAVADRLERPREHRLNQSVTLGRDAVGEERVAESLIESDRRLLLAERRGERA
ncbi:hypothetical protein QE381_002216 [Microbacterium sp. SORGH_AS 888]|nr:hypothetical protein [Microbacterium sp. SORGH_AS_0888]